MARTKKDPEERKAEIFEAARRLFIEKGFEATTVSDIVKSVGVSQGTFYWYFASKEDVLEVVADDYAREYQEEMEGILTSKRLNAVDKLELIFKWLERAAREGGRLVDELHMEKHRRFHYRMVQRVAGRWMELIRGVIREGIEEGLFDLPDPDVAAMFLSLPMLFAGTEEDFPILGKMSKKKWLKAYREIVYRILGYEGPRK